MKQKNDFQMKKTILLLMLVSWFSISLLAQTEEKQSQAFKDVVGVSPLRLWNGLRIKYERVLTPKITCGGILTGYYGLYPGVQLAPVARFYFKGKAPEGFYLQAKIVSGFFQSSYIDVVLDESGNPVKKRNGDNIYEDRKQLFSNFGAGIAAGYQFLWGTNNSWSVDINLGLKVVGNVPESNESDIWKIQSFVDSITWYLTGPGSIVDGLISIGYRF
jgi:hypothetical protein